MIEIHIPKMGMSTQEIDVVEVSVAPGQRVEPGVALMEIEGDKATFTIAAEVGGVVAEILVKEGDVCHVGDVVMKIDEEAAE